MQLIYSCDQSIQFPWTLNWFLGSHLFLVFGLISTIVNGHVVFPSQHEKYSRRQGLKCKEETRINLQVAVEDRELQSAKTLLVKDL